MASKPIILDEKELGAPTIPNTRKKIFADQYLSGKSATQAAIDAGYSVRSADSLGRQMLAQPIVAAYIAYHRQQATEKAQLSAQRWTEELSRIAFSNVKDYTRLDPETGELVVDFSGATEDQLAALQSVKTKKRKIYNSKGELIGEESDSEFRLWDKLRAAELLGKHAGFLREPEQKVVIDVADRLLNARARLLTQRAEPTQISQSLSDLG
ncbi:MAG: terminase small subunit, partial [Desulfurellales bacterium]